MAFVWEFLIRSVRPVVLHGVALVEPDANFYIDQLSMVTIKYASTRRLNLIKFHNALPAAHVCCLALIFPKRQRRGVCQNAASVNN